jgi:2-polyprenyl-3-methyl-5-hydroxy-6-metoxy-1,4-benzoquinol methylase
MMPPRYLLRKSTVLELMEGRPRGRFLELGYGTGDMLATLASRGFEGVGYDISASARETATQRLRRDGVSSVTLAAEMPAGPFDYVFFFEVIGYWDDPIAELHRLREELAPSGCMIFSFLNARQQGAADRLTGNYRGFSRPEVLEFLEKAQLEAEAFWNYGYPLANLLKPVLDLYHWTRAYLRPEEAQSCAMHVSGLPEKHLANRVAGAVFNPIALAPFVRAQRLFRNTDLGAGYVVLARPRGAMSLSPAKAG